MSNRNYSRDLPAVEVFDNDVHRALHDFRRRTHSILREVRRREFFVSPSKRRRKKKKSLGDR